MQHTIVAFHRRGNAVNRVFTRRVALMLIVAVLVVAAFAAVHMTSPAPSISSSLQSGVLYNCPSVGYHC